MIDLMGEKNCLASDAVQNESELISKAKIRDRYNCLLNLHQHPNYYGIGQDIAREYLIQSMATMPVCPPFTKTILREWLEREYAQTLTYMHQGFYLDTGHIGGGEYGRFSTKAVAERLLQNAPNNFVDGAWLAGVIPCGSATEAEALLAKIRYEESGGGHYEQNHPNLFAQLLRSLNIELPSVYSPEFSQRSIFIDSAFIMPVFQLSIGKHPRLFLPEILGMTLWFEWNSTPISLAIAKCLRQRGIDDEYYKAHQSIDNRHSGHGAIALKAAEAHLKVIQNRGLDIESHWKRIWQGYYAWAALDSQFEAELQHHLLRFDGKK
jgi:hypothetical protein